MKPSRETVIIIGHEQDPAIQETKRRIEAAGRNVVVQARADHDTGLGICGRHYCSCTEPCRSIQFEKVQTLKRKS